MPYPEKLELEETKTMKTLSWRKQKTMKTITMLLAAALLAIPAMAQDVRYNFDDQADFSKYTTYRWEKHPDSIELDDLTRRQLFAAFNAEFAKKGLVAAVAGDAEIVIVYQAAVRQEKQISTFSTDWGYGPGWRRGGWYGPRSEVLTSTTETIQIGSLSLDMYDAASKRIIWRGVATKTLDTNAKPDKRQKNMVKAVEKLLKNYPPKKK